jgi:hypothetical protein
MIFFPFFLLTFLEIFDPATRFWSTWKSPPVPTGAGACLIVAGDNQFYLFGGATSIYVQIYNPATNSWVNQAQMLYPTGHTGCSLLPSDPFLVSRDPFSVSRDPFLISQDAFPVS